MIASAPESMPWCVDPQLGSSPVKIWTGMVSVSNFMMLPRPRDLRLRPPDHVIALFTNHRARGESEISPGRFAPYSYSPGAINVFPPGRLFLLADRLRTQR
jgi:hypothetical protein